MSQFRRKLLESYATNKLVYPGLIAAWSAKGKTNDDADRNVLKDLTGNGHDITLRNFAYSGMSGYGGYSFSFKQFNSGYHSTKVIREITEDTNAGRWLIVNTNLGFTAPEFRIKYKVVGNSGLVYTYTDKNGSRRDLSIVKSNSGGGSGEITIPQCYSSVVELNGFTYYAHLGSITIELLPEYPDALVFDGVDDYGVNESLPSLTDYTVISKIYWITSPNAGVYAYGKASTEEDVKYPSNICFSSYSSIGRDVSHLFNFGADTNVKSYVNPTINYHNTKVFNGIPINKGTAIDNNYPLHLGRIWANHGGLCNMAFYSFYLFNRTLTDEEIKSFIRKHIDPEYLLPSEQIPTPNVYYDFTNGDNTSETRETIVDLSGNGNDATAHNFAWNEESGYAEGGGIKV